MSPKKFVCRPRPLQASLGAGQGLGRAKGGRGSTRTPSAPHIRDPPPIVSDLISLPTDLLVLHGLQGRCETRNLPASVTHPSLCPLPRG